MRINIPVMVALLTVPTGLLLVAVSWYSGYDPLDAVRGVGFAHPIGVLILSLLHKWAHGSWGWR